MGAETMRKAIAALVPSADFMHRERFSELSYSGQKKISRMPERSAIVSFSVDNVYGIAELLRRQKGGAAVVMGALSPRTRNAQVEMYQNGDVDYLVATDAIGMGLNLDVNHVAFSATSKFDGNRMRPLLPTELAQIAGRAGRHMNNGSFGVTGESAPLQDELVEAITENRFAPLTKLYWRNSKLQFGSTKALISALEQHTSNEWLTRVRESCDLAALKALVQDGEIAARASDGASVALLWDVCRIPDFRSISNRQHAELLGVIYNYLHEKGQIPQDWLARSINSLDNTKGDIDALSKRLAYIRTWTYVAQRKDWAHDHEHWREATRAVEDRLSDALHIALTQRFVDRRTSILMRRLKQKESLVADVNKDGEVTVEGQFVGRLEGFQFRQDASASPDEAKTLRSASLQALAPEFHLRADRMYNAPDTEIDFTEQGGLMWGSSAVGKLIAGSNALKPHVQAFVDVEAGPEVAEKVARRLQHFIDRKISTLFEPLINMQRDESLTGMARGFAFQMIEGLGVLDRADVGEDVKSLDQEARSALRKHGIRFGQFTIFMPLLLKPSPTRLRLLLWSLDSGLQEFPEAPPAGLVTVPTDETKPAGYHLKSGYRAAGQRALRVDMAERLADMLRTQDTRGGFEATADMLSITGMTLEQFADLMQGLGYRAEKAERIKVKAPAATPVAEEPASDADASGDVPSQAIETAPQDAPTAEVSSADPEAAAAAGTDASEADASKEAAPVEMEVYYTFAWGAKRVDRSADGPRKGQKPRGKPKQDRRAKGKGGKSGGNSGKAERFEARPPKRDKPIDPDNPFAAALMGFSKK
jgi:ATP-dependent RNA helicase SUPV3L1/SUV3